MSRQHCLKILLLSLISLYSVHPAISQNSIDDKAFLPLKERLSEDIQRFKYSKNDDEILSSLQDIASYVHSKSEIEPLLSEIENRLNGLKEKATLSQEIQLQKAKLLAKIDRWDAAQPLFDAAVAEEWPDAVSIYVQTLTDTRRNRQRAIEEFNHCLGKSDYLDFRGRQEDLSVFISVLLEAKDEEQNFNASLEVFPQLVVNDENPYQLELARGICLAIDGKVKEGIASLLSINEAARTNSEAEAEYKAIPLYIAWLQYDAGRNQEANSWLDQYWQRNKDDPGHVLGRILRITYYFQRKASLKPKITNVTTWLLQSEIFSNPDIKSVVNAEVETVPAYKKSCLLIYTHMFLRFMRMGFRGNAIGMKLLLFGTN